MSRALSNVRANQKSAIGLSNGLFNGLIAITALIFDPKKLTFQANITFQTGDVAHPSYTFTPCTDDGEVKKFTAIDDIINWVNGAFLDVSAITVTVDEASKIAKAFVAPSDPVADGLKKKAAFTKLLAGIQDNKTKSLATVAAAEGFGWNLPAANPALQANYALLVAKKDAVLAIETYYTDQIAFYS